MIRPFILLATLAAASSAAKAQCTIVLDHFNDVPVGTNLSNIQGWAGTSSDFTVSDSLTPTPAATASLAQGSTAQAQRTIPSIMRERGQISFDIDVRLDCQIGLNCSPSATQVGLVGVVQFTCELDGTLMLTSQGTAMVVDGGGPIRMVYTYDTQGDLTITYNNVLIDSYSWASGTGNCVDARGLFFNAAQPMASTCDGTVTIDNVHFESVVGTGYCQGNPNSTGEIATLCAGGSASVAAADLLLRARTLPQYSMTFFIVSETQGFVPLVGGSEGNLCVSGSVGRYVLPGQIQNSGANGIASLVVDLGMTPQPTGFVAAQAGDVWNFQAWCRDVDAMGVPTSNLTTGLSVVVTP